MAPSLGPSLANHGHSSWQPDRTRFHRKRIVRSKTIRIRQVPKPAPKAPATTDEERPRTRADCANVPRPCPFVGCKYNLYLDVHPETGNIKLNFPDLEPGEMVVSCVLDVADDGGATMGAVAEAMNLGLPRIDRIEAEIRTKLRRLPLYVDEAAE